VKASDGTYEGLSEATTYFSVTNTTDSADEFSVQTYFPAGIGEVTSLEVFNQNKPRTAMIPEYRPYVYHCEDGWEYQGEQVPASLDELSRQLAEEAPITETGDETIASTASTTTEATVNEATATTTEMTFSGEESPDIATHSEVVTNVEDQVPVYSCRNTTVVRECDELDGANTACVMQEVKVAEHELTRYEPGWETVSVAEGEQPRPGLIRRVIEFVGFGPDRKDVPEQFEVRAHTPGAYTIEPVKPNTLNGHLVPTVYGW
jgi:hypothetical protein